MSANCDINRWLGWIDQIKNDVTDILSNQEIFEEYRGIVGENKEVQTPADFHIWVIRNYSAYIAMAIRRQLETGNDVVSLKKLLVDIKKHCSSLTKEWHRGLGYHDWHPSMPGSGESQADQDFKNLAGNLDYIDPNLVEKDIKGLTELGKRAYEYADKVVAHNIGMASLPPTFDEMRKVVEEIEVMTRKYYLLFTGGHYSSLQLDYEYNWKVIFTKPWINKPSG
jgi:hypothetical protein